MDVYIKPAKKVTLAERDALYIRDVAQVYSPGGADCRAIGDLRLMGFGRERGTYLISGLDVIKRIGRQLPGATVSNVGELDTVVEYSPVKKKGRGAWKFLQVAFIAAVLFAGSATAIMSFHTDGEIPKVFQKYYEIFFGEKTAKPYIINIPYSVGLAIGIVVFFNHVGGRKLTNDPTPIEVQMSVYDDEVTQTLVNALSAEGDAPK